MHRLFLITGIVVVGAALAAPAVAGWWDQSPLEDGAAFIVGYGLRSMERDISGGDADSGTFESDESYVRIGMGLDCGRVFLDVGQAEPEPELTFSNLGAKQVGVYDLESTPYFAFGFQGLFPMGEDGNGWCAGFGLKLAFWLPADAEGVQLSGVESTNVDGDISANEVQLDLLGGYSFMDGCLKPYAGVRLSGMTVSFDEVQYTAGGTAYADDGDIHADDNFGLVGGVEVCLPNDRVAISVEASVGDADSVAGNIELRF